MIKLTLDELKAMVSRMENQIKYNSMQEHVRITIGKHPNGRQYLEFEQPCYYAECNSTYYRYDELIREK